MPSRPRSFTKDIRDKHKPKFHNWGDDRIRGNRHERGYGTDWTNLRNDYVAEHPLCEKCLEVGRVEPTHTVDHIIPFKGIDDPLRLDRENLQSLCENCHQQKTAKTSALARKKVITS